MRKSKKSVQGGTPRRASSGRAPRSLQTLRDLAWHRASQQTRAKNAARAARDGFVRRLLLTLPAKTRSGFWTTGILDTIAELEEGHALVLPAPYLEDRGFGRGGLDRAARAWRQYGIVVRQFTIDHRIPRHVPKPTYNFVVIFGV